MARNPYYAAATNLSVPNVSGRIGQTVALTATLTSGGSYVTGKTVSFSVDGAPAGSDTTDGIGFATVTYSIPPSLGAGSKTIGASFAGEVNYAKSSEAATLKVSKANVAFSAYQVWGARGQTVTLKSLLYASNAPLAGRNVDFSVDGMYVGTGVSTSTNVSCSYKIPDDATFGPHNVTVAFAGDDAYNASTRTGPVLNVGVPKANVAFSAYQVWGARGQTVTLKSLMWSAGVPLAGKNVDFSVDGMYVGTGVSTSTNVSCSYKIPDDATFGPHNVTVAFAGDDAYNASTRTGAALTVK